MKFSGAGISNLIIIVWLCFRSRDYQLKKSSLLCHLPCLQSRSTASVPTCIGISTMHHGCMTTIIRVALQELSYTTYIEIRCHCFRLGSLASGYLTATASRRASLEQLGASPASPRRFMQPCLRAGVWMPHSFGVIGEGYTRKREGSCKFDLLESGGAGR